MWRSKTSKPSSEKKMAEDNGEGWLDASDRWIDRVRTEVVLFSQLVEVYEKLNARNASRNPAEPGV